LSDTKVYEPSIRARLGTAAHFCEVVVLKLRTGPLPREQGTTEKGVLSDICLKNGSCQGQNMAVSVLHVPSSFERGGAGSARARQPLPPHLQPWDCLRGAEGLFDCIRLKLDPFRLTRADLRRQVQGVKFRLKRCFFARVRIVDSTLHTVDYDPFIKSQLASRN